MSLGPDELNKLHDDFWQALAAVIPADAMDAARAPGSVEDDIVRAVKILARKAVGLDALLLQLYGVTGRSSKAGAITAIEAYKEKAWMYDDLSR